MLMHTNRLADMLPSLLCCLFVRSLPPLCRASLASSLGDTKEAVAGTSSASRLYFIAFHLDNIKRTRMEWKRREDD